MAKRSSIAASGTAVSAKGARVSLCAEIKGRLWDVFPPTPEENKKGWRSRVARELTHLAKKAGYADVQVTPRRVRAVMNGEARRIDGIEVKLIELREQINELEQGATKRRGALNDIAIGIATAKAAIRDDARGAAAGMRAAAGDRARQGAGRDRGEPGGDGSVQRDQAPAGNTAVPGTVEGDDPDLLKRAGEA